MVLAGEPCAVCALVVFLLGLVSVGVLCCSVLVGVPADETARYLYCLVLLGVLYGVKCQIAFLLAVTLLLIAPPPQQCDSAVHVVCTPPGTGLLFQRLPIWGRGVTLAGV
jgi:hypothetical protein